MITTVIKRAWFYKNCPFSLYHNAVAQSSYVFHVQKQNYLISHFAFLPARVRKWWINVRNSPLHCVLSLQTTASSSLLPPATQGHENLELFQSLPATFSCGWLLYPRVIRALRSSTSLFSREIYHLEYTSSSCQQVALIILHRHITKYIRSVVYTSVIKNTLSKYIEPIKLRHLWSRSQPQFRP